MFIGDGWGFCDERLFVEEFMEMIKVVGGDRREMSG